MATSSPTRRAKLSCVEEATEQECQVRKSPRRKWRVRVASSLHRIFGSSNEAVEGRHMASMRGATRVTFHCGQLPQHGRTAIPSYLKPRPPAACQSPLSAASLHVALEQRGRCGPSPCSPPQTRRKASSANALCGMSRKAAAEAAGMDRQTLRDWIIRCNEHGIDAIAGRGTPCRPAAMASRSPAH